MRLHVAHVFPCSPEAFIALLQEPDFERVLADSSRVARATISEEVRDGKVHKRVRCTPERTLPAMLQTAIGADRIRYEQVSVLDPATGSLQWRIHPDKVDDRVDIHGTMTVRPHAEGCERIVTGSVEVKVRFVGGQIEKAIVADVEASYAKSYAAVRELVVARQAQA